jgi:transcriptional regulator with XRE-family HTH domain
MSEARRELILLMEATRTSQKRLADLLGIATTTVNRWVRDERNDTLDPPFYAVNFMRAYIQLPDKTRERLPVQLQRRGAPGIRLATA